LTAGGRCACRARLRVSGTRPSAAAEGRGGDLRDGDRTRLEPEQPRQAVPGKLGVGERTGEQGAEQRDAEGHAPRQSNSAAARECPKSREAGPLP